MASVSVGIWVGVGSRFEPKEVNGVSHFIEHMLFKGTKRRSAAEISQAVEGIGGYLNAWTSEESTCFYSKARHDKFDELLDVLADMFLNSKFDPFEIGKEREVIKEEVAMYRDQPQQYVHELLNETLWPDQPLGRSITGDEKTLNAIARPDLVDYLRSNYVTGCTLVAAAGRLEHKRVVKAVERYAKNFSPGNRPIFSAVREKQDGPRIRLHTKKTEQTQIALGLRTCSRHDERRYAIRILNVILGENMSSRLFQTIREEHGLAYSIYSSPSFFHDTGDLVISAGLDPDNVEKTLKLIIRELKKMAAQVPSLGEMRRARDYVIGQLDMSLENTEPQMSWLGENWLGYGKIYQPEEVKKRLSKVTGADVREIAQSFFRPERMNLALVSPLKSEASLLKLLKL